MENRAANVVENSRPPQTKPKQILNKWREENETEHS